MDGIMPHWTKAAGDVPGLDSTKLYEALKHVHQVPVGKSADSQLRKAIFHCCSGVARLGRL